MLKRICDRCNKEIIGNYWTIDIYQHEDRSGKISSTGALNNLQENIDKLFDKKKRILRGLYKRNKRKNSKII